MKKIILSVIISFILLFNLSGISYAAPDVIYSGDVGTSGLLTITNPDKDYNSTYNSSYSISGFTKSGATVYVYISDGSAYKPNFEYQTYVGESGMFVIPVKLQKGKNSILIHSEVNGQYQNETFEINLLSSSMYNLIQNLKNSLFK